MMKRKTADEFFRKKLPGAEKYEGARHTAYKICDANGRVLLGNLTFSRGAAGEDLSLRNLKGLAEDLGLSLEGLIEASSCRIRATVVAICAAARVIETAREMHELDPNAFDRPMVVALEKALEAWLGGIEREKGKLSGRESKELHRGLSRLRDASRDGLFTSMSMKLGQYADDRLVVG